MVESFTDSLGTTFHKIKQQYNVPEFVKNANQKDICPDFEPDVLVRICADPVNLRYPCHTKSATWVSAAYLADEYEKLPDQYRKEVGARIEKFAEFHGIQDQIKSLVRNKTQQIKQASVQQTYPDDYYAIATREKRAGLMVDKNGVYKAAEWLLSNRNKLPLHVCTKIATRICKRASALNVPVPYEERMERLLGCGFNDTETIANGLRKRANAGRYLVPSLSLTMDNIANEMETNPPEIGSNTMFKLACFIDEFDHRAGLIAARERGDYILPEDIVYRHTVSGLTKAASNNVKLQNGHVYSLSDLDSLDRHDFESNFGSELTDECFHGTELNKEAAARVLPTLPRPMADQLAGLLRKQGKAPALREKAAALTIPQIFFK